MMEEMEGKSTAVNHEGRHILLTYLSDIKTNREKTVLSAPSYYEEIGEHGAFTMSSNESAVRYLQENCGIVPERIFAFATDTVRDSINKTVGTMKITHLEYFRNCLRNAGLDVDRMMPANIYDPKGKSPVETGTTNIYACEDVEDTAQSIQSSIGMAALIARYVRAPGRKPEDYVLDVDLTGGPRDAVMILLSVMHMLQYRGFNIGKVLYSHWERADNKNNKVQCPGGETVSISGTGDVLESDDIYHLQDFISGAAEFTNYGSVEELKKYFALRGQKSKELSALLGAMDHFAKAIQLSRRGEFQDAVDGLRRALRHFEDIDEGKAVMAEQSAHKTAVLSPEQQNNALIRLIIRRIYKEYGALLASHDDLVKIQWCLDHNYLQQALTLCTECIPELLFKEKLVQMEADEEEKARKEWGNVPTAFEVYILNEYKPEGVLKGKALQGIFTREAKEFLKQLKNENQPLLLAFHKECRQAFQEQKSQQNGTGLDPRLGDTIKKKLWEEKYWPEIEKQGLRQDFIEWVDHLRQKYAAAWKDEEKVWKEILQWAWKMNTQDFSKYANRNLCKDFGDAKALESDSRYDQMRKMIESGVLIPRDKAQFLAIMEAYYEVKALRNNSAHARKDTNRMYDFDTTKALMETLIADIRKALAGRA